MADSQKGYPEYVFRADGVVGDFEAMRSADRYVRRYVRQEVTVVYERRRCGTWSRGPFPLALSWLGLPASGRAKTVRKTGAVVFSDRF